MAGTIEASQIAGEQPTVHYGFGSELGIVEVMRHDGFATGSDFANTVSVRIQDAKFHSRQWLAHCVRAEWLQVIHGQYRAGLGQSVTISDGNPQIVEKLQSRRVHECAPGEHRQQLSTENFVDLRQQFAAKRHVRSFTSEELIDQN